MSLILKVKTYFKFNVFHQNHVPMYRMYCEKEEVRDEDSSPSIHIVHIHSFDTGASLLLRTPGVPYTVQWSIIAPLLMHKWKVCVLLVQFIKEMLQRKPSVFRSPHSRRRLHRRRGAHCRRGLNHRRRGHTGRRRYTGRGTNGRRRCYAGRRLHLDRYMGVKVC